MNCPTCGHHHLLYITGVTTFRSVKLGAHWKECPACGEKMWSAKEIKRMIEETKVVSFKELCEEKLLVRSAAKREAQHKVDARTKLLRDILSVVNEIGLYVIGGDDYWSLFVVDTLPGGERARVIKWYARIESGYQVLTENGRPTRWETSEEGAATRVKLSNSSSPGDYWDECVVDGSEDSLVELVNWAHNQLAEYAITAGLVKLVV